jgi:predicted ATPase/DNA-binding SARP family transcriptional activator
MGCLSLNLFGSPDARHVGRPLKFRTRKAFALLIYLAVERGTHSREKITALFWPDSDAPHGRTMLRTTLAYLRQSLDDDASPAHLLVNRDALGFDHGSDFDLDLDRFEAAFRLASTWAGASPALADAQLLQQAAECYRGGFLAGFSLGDAPDFDDWIRLQREVWHQRMGVVLDGLTLIQSHLGEFAHAIETATRWVAHDPWNENAHQRLIRLHVAAGDRTAALRAYDQCQATLAAELNISPSPETEALAELARAARSQPQLLSHQHALSSRPALPQGALVGRTSQHANLVAAFHAIQHGPAQVMLLTGEAGIGKTRLAAEFLSWASAHRADVLQGRAFETSGSLPYQPLVECLRNRIERENAPVDLLNDTWLAELSRLLPELRERYPDLPPSTGDEATARVRLFEAAARLGLALAERAPVVIFIDDIHWADGASLDMLHYIGRRWQESGAHILLVLSFRSEALATSPELATWLGALERDQNTTRLLLPSLTAEETIRLVQTLTLDRHASMVEQFGRWLYAETRGQPFYIHETLKALIERQLLSLQAEGDGIWSLAVEAPVRDVARLHGLLPAGVREVIRSRLAQLTPTAMALLTAAAVLDHEFSFEQLCRVADLTEQESLVALDHILRGGQLAETTQRRSTLARAPRTGEQQPGSSLPLVTTYSFTHAKIRDVVYTEAGDARRRIFHRRALYVLEQVAAPPATLAHHAYQAGMAEPAFGLSVAAGDDALQLFAIREAIALYEQARELWSAHEAEQTPDLAIPIAALQQLHSQLGRAYELNNDKESARTIYQAMLAFAREAGAAPMECAALNRLATLAVHEHYNLEQAAELLHEARMVAERIGESVELAETYWNLAQLSLYRLDKDVHAIAERALALARRLGLQELIARNLNVLIYANVGHGRWAEAEANALEACALFRALGNRTMVVDCLCQAASAQINLGRPHDGIATARTAQAMSLAIENIWGQANCAITLALGFVEIGCYGEALETAERGLSLARACGMGIMLVDGLVALGIVHRALLDLETARTLHAEALVLGEPVGIQLIIEIVAAEICADCALAGNWDEAYAYAVQSLTDRSYAIARTTQLTLWLQTEALIRAGDLDRASADIEGYNQRLGYSPRYRIAYLRARAVLAQYRGKLARSIEDLREAAQLAEEIGLPGELWPIYVHTGRLYQACGNAAEARDCFARAVMLVHTLAQSIEEGQRRANFLAAPHVRYVVERGA